MRGCWDQDPASRLGFSEIHSILRSLHMTEVSVMASPHGHQTNGSFDATEGSGVLSSLSISNASQLQMDEYVLLES